MANLLTRKLELFGPLPEDDKHLLDETIKRTRHLGAHQDIIREGDAPEDVHLVIEGFACRHKILPDGGRQIFAYLVPGDFCDLNIFVLKQMDHNISTLSPCSVVEIPRERILQMTRRPDLVRSLWWATLVDEAVLREWLVNMGQRDAEERVAHLFCELHLRLKAVGLADGGQFALPITQGELGDTLGLSTVHVNRTVQRLRSRNLIALGGGTLKILNLQGLKEMSGFDPNYLHLEGGKHDRDQAIGSVD